MADAASSAAAAPRLRRAATAASHGAASSSSSSGAGAPSARRSRSSSQHRSGRHGHHRHHHHHGHGHHQQQQLEQQRRRHQQELQRYLHYHPYAHLYAEPEPRPRDPFHVRESERLQSDAVGALSAGEWGELLGADEGADLARLREAARHGVPSAVRGDAWLLLLGVWGSDRSDDVARGKEMREEFAALAAAAEAAVRGVPSVARAVDTAVLRRVRHAIDEYVEAREGDALFARFEAAEAARRGEAAAVAAARGGHSLHHLQHHVQRHHHHHHDQRRRHHHHRHGRAGGDAGGGGAGSKASSSGDLAMWAEQPHDGRRRYEASSFAARAEAVLVAYLAGENAAFRPEMVSLAAPFVVVHRSVVDAFNAFRQAMQYVTYHAGGRREGEHLARLVALFRRYLPRLCECFEDEEVTPNDWALPWIRTLLASSLPLECVVRLWDTYFSADEGLDLHVFVCVAVLRRFNEELEEFEHSELRGFLDHLPVAGMDQVIQRALNMHGEARGDS